MAHRLSIFFVMCAVLFACLNLPLFDLDEALYRRIAEEMIASKSYILPTWDNAPYYHKPPLHAWLILLSHWLIDNQDLRISSFAARFPSYIAWLATGYVLLIYFKKRFLRKEPWELSKPILVWGAGLAPVLGGMIVLIDPFLTLCLTIAITQTLNLLYQDENQFSYKYALVLTLSVAAACAFKGLIGIIIPAMSTIIYLLIYENRRSHLWKRFFFIYLASVVCSSFLFLAIYQSGGEDFIREFFLKHHFGRGMKAMEGHSGPFYYYILVLLMGASPLIFYLSRNPPQPSARNRFLITWCCFTLLFFSLLATKLPNYIWPLFPALVLLTIGDVDQHRGRKEFLSFMKGLNLVYLILSCACVALPFFIFSSDLLIAHKQFISLVPLLSLYRQDVWMICTLVGFYFMFIFILQHKILNPQQHPGPIWTRLNLLNGVFVFGLTYLLAPLVKENITKALVTLNETIKSSNHPTEQIGSYKFQSPNVSSTFAPLHIRRIDEQDLEKNANLPHFLLTELWHADICNQPPYSLVLKSGAYALCKLDK